jgi:hypothetical protein
MNLKMEWPLEAVILEREPEFQPGAADSMFTEEPLS